MAKKSEPPAAWKAAKPFFNGGLSGMFATCIIQPIDMVKVRIQLGATGSPVSTPAPVPPGPTSPAFAPRRSTDAANG
jgi:solute carrier family 25 oxoglutarate transporter 11